MLASLIVTFVRHKIPGMAPNDAAQYFQPEFLNELKNEIEKRFNSNPRLYKYFETELKKLSDDWENKVNNYGLKYYYKKGQVSLLKKPDEKELNSNKHWTIMQSMREIDTNSFIRIDLPK